MAAVVSAVAVTLVVRYVTFDPKHFVAEIEERLNPMRPPKTAEASRAAGSASSAPSPAASASAPVSAAERVKQFELRMAAMRQRYHGSSGPCFRYPTKDAAAALPENAADEVADALLAANLTGRFDGLMPASARWAQDADSAVHAASRDVEIVDFFAGADGLWTRLGVAMHRNATLEAARAAFETKPPPESNKPLTPEEEARARPLWDRYGHLQLLQGAMRIAFRMHSVDLRGAQLRLLEPGMDQSTVRARLGAAEENGQQWRYPNFGTEVSFNEQGLVTGIASMLTFDDRVIVDGAQQRSLDEPSLSRVMGKPLRDAQGERGETVLVYGAGPHAMLLVFGRQLGRVELWRKDLILSAGR